MSQDQLYIYGLAFCEDSAVCGRSRLYIIMMMAVSRSERERVNNLTNPTKRYGFGTFLQTMTSEFTAHTHTE